MQANPIHEEILWETAQNAATQVRNAMGVIQAAALARQARAWRLKKDRLADEAAMAAVAGLNNKLEELIDLCRPLNLKPKPLRLEGLLDTACLLFEEHCRRRGISLTRRFEPPGITMAADSAALRRALAQILLNAVEAVLVHGTIEISLKLDRHSGQSRNPDERSPVPGSSLAVIIEIHDNGVGIRPEHLDSVTHPFFSTKPGHSGLGLSQAKRIITGHNGSLSINSPPGQGTTVRIELPE